MTDVTSETLKLDRSLANDAFSSWRLSRGLVLSQNAYSLPSSVYRPESAGLDYLHMRNAFLHNNLLASTPSCSYIFLRGSEGPALHKLSSGGTVTRLLGATSDEPGKPTLIRSKVK
jgi:hypothetical protein